MFYQVDAAFRGDPYPGALSALDYLLCREGKTFEDRGKNLVLVWGKIEPNHVDKTLNIIGDSERGVAKFCEGVQASERHNLLTYDYDQLASDNIPRYYMQVRYGSTFSKSKHIRVYAYFADVILFPDGVLWREA